MPIYMDRHDVSESVTAETIALLHQQDIRIQDRFGCRGLTYWFDDNRKTAFCLIEAPHIDAIREMHDFAHGNVPHRVIEVDPAVVDAFLGRIDDPVKPRDVELNIINDPAFRTLMVIHIRRLSLMKDYLANFRTEAQQVAAMIPGILRSFNGNLVRHNNEHFLISFRSVSHAVHSALQLRKTFSATSNGRMLFKIGLSTGVPVTEKNQIFEDAIRLADRMVMLAKDDIIVSAEVRELYDSENPLPLSEREGIGSLTPADELFVTQLMEHAENALNDLRWKVDDLNKALGFSKPGFYRKMIGLTGKSPVDFIKEYRLNEALTLLNRKAGNVSQIAYETGFSSPSYFAKCFQKRYGRSPADYLMAGAN